jgi:hypothetical protein
LQGTNLSGRIFCTHPKRALAREIIDGDIKHGAGPLVAGTLFANRIILKIAADFDLETSDIHLMDHCTAPLRNRQRIS